MIVGPSYYQFSQDDYNTIKTLFGSDVAAMLTLDEKHGIYFAEEESAFADWLSNDEYALDILQENGIDTGCGPFQPNSGEGAGDG